MLLCQIHTRQHTQVTMKQACCPNAKAFCMLFWHHTEGHRNGLPDEKTPKEDCSMSACLQTKQSLHAHQPFRLRPWPYSPNRASHLTVCLLVRRHCDILQSLRPAVSLCLATRQGARGTGSAAPAASPGSPAVPALLITPFLVVVLRLLLLLLLLAHLGYVVVGVWVSGGAVEGIVAAVIPGLAEHVVRNLQTLVPGAGRFQERQCLPPALRHLSL